MAMGGITPERLTIYFKDACFLLVDLKSRTNYGELNE